MAHAVRAMFGNFEVPCDVERRRLSRGERRREIDFHHRTFDARLERDLSNAEHLVEPIEGGAALETASAKTRVWREDVGVERPALECVLLDLEPGVAERVRRIVRVAKRELA